MPAADGVIHDIGYQRYTGRRLGRGYAVRSLYIHGLRTAFGLGRTAKAKIFPFFVVGVVFAIAAVATAIRSQANEVVLTYLQFSDVVSAAVLLFLAVVAPELVSRDLRSRTLSLYFARPMRRDDYALARLGAMISAIWLVLASPQVLMYLGALFSQHRGLTGAWQETLDLLGGWAYAAMYAIVFGSIALLVASLVGRRAVAAAAIVAVFLATAPVVGILQVIGGDTLRQLARLVNPVILMQGLKSWIFHTKGMNVGGYGAVYATFAVLLVAACVGLLLVRYRRVDA